jgi:arylsulfatase A-like enzyme
MSKQFSRTLALVLSLAFLPAISVAKDAPRPNIIFMMADDLGWADVEFHGGNVPTPNLKQLLGEGVELRQHYVAPVCSPTRTGLMTGRYWSRFGVTTPTNSLALPFETVTVAKALGEAGYETCITGKWHLGSKSEWGPNHFGFDHSYGSMAGGVTPWSHFYKQGPFSVTWHRNEEFITEQGHVTDLIAKEAIQWLETRSDDKPFFLYVPFTAVHLPIREPEAWMARVPNEISGEVPRHYAACILHLDDAVGRIVEAVKKAGKSDNTLIVFTSDNGGSTAENNDTKYPDDNCPNGKLPGNNLPLRGAKGDLYEGGTRVPTIARWPGKLEAGTSCETAVHIVDWMPTFCHLAGSKADATKLKWDGANIWPAISGTGSLAARSLYSAGTSFRSQALRRGDWKLIVFAGRDGTEGRVELFNITEDPNEKNDLAKSNLDKTAEMKRELQAAAAVDRDAMALGG